MVTTVIIGMLCVHLLCFCVMFFLISTRLSGRKMGMEVFALGNLLLGLAYILQLLDGPVSTGALGFINHTLTLCSPFVYLLGALRFFKRPTPVLGPLLTLAAGYTLAQLLVQLTLGTEARYALLSGSCAALFLVMTLGALRVRRGIARDLHIEMAVFAVLIGALCILNAAKLGVILSLGLQALDLNSSFQRTFYLYMSFLGTLTPPCALWLVLRRLTDELRSLAVHDPLTGLLNRRGLRDGLEAHFRSRSARPVYLLLIDIDHFKRINDSRGHVAGDQVLMHVASLLRASARQGDLICRLGGEEFMVVCQDSDRAGAMRLAERIRVAIEGSEVGDASTGQAIRCTATIGVSDALSAAQELDHFMHQADAALYRGKSSGRNRVVWAHA